MWKEVVEKTGNTKAKSNLQPAFYVREIDSRCPKSHCPLVKKNKKDTYWEHHNEVFKDKEKDKSYNLSFANQAQIQNFKKCHKSQQKGRPATAVNGTKGNKER